MPEPEEYFQNAESDLRKFRSGGRFLISLANPKRASSRQTVSTFSHTEVAQRENDVTLRDKRIQFLKIFLTLKPA